uniref:Uncharacterized protein n=1 Tax=Arundo donax TaxID=35708 RepID=A0A0A9ADC4_ARUDO
MMRRGSTAEQRASAGQRCPGLTAPPFIQATAAACPRPLVLTAAPTCAVVAAGGANRRNGGCWPRRDT